MVKRNITIKMEHELWEKAEKAYDNRSARIRELLEQDLGSDTTGKKKRKIIPKHLTPKQKKLAKILLKKELPISKTRLGKIAKEEQLYTRRDHIRYARKAILNCDELPFNVENGRIVFDKIVCDCGLKLTPNILIEKNGCECIKCGAEYVI